MIDIAVEVLSNEVQKIQDDLHIDVVRAMSENGTIFWYIKYMGINISIGEKTLCFNSIDEVEKLLLKLKKVEMLLNFGYEYVG